MHGKLVHPAGLHRIDPGIVPHIVAIAAGVAKPEGTPLMSVIADTVTFTDLLLVGTFTPPDLVTSSGRDRSPGERSEVFACVGADIPPTRQEAGMSLPRGR
jgi:hypothetical protein